MELKNLIKNMSNDKISLDSKEIRIGTIIVDRKYNILREFLSQKKICTTNDLKRLNYSDFNKLKMEIPNIEGVGEEKTNMFIRVLDKIRKTNNDTQNNLNSIIYPIVENLGKFEINTNWHVEINYIKYNKYDEYIDIRQIKNDGTRGKGISIKKQDFNQFKNIISSIELDNNHVDDKTFTTTNGEHFSENVNGESNFEDTLFSQLKSKTLKEQILENEDKLYEEFKDDFGLAIKFFKAKIESLREDGDIVKFLENSSILEIKKEQYDKTHSKGLKTAIDIKNEFDKTNIKYTTIENLVKYEKVNTMTICSIVNNFNTMLGMYYDSEHKSLILKCQLKDGPYGDRWIDMDKKIYYCLQNEQKENFSKLSFSKYPNTICKNIIFGYDLDTKVYLFYRYKEKDDYTFAGEVKLEKFVDRNRAVIINICNNNESILSELY